MIRSLLLMSLALPALLSLPAPASAQSVLDITRVPADAVAAAAVFPRALAASEEMELLPREVISAASRQELGLDVLQIDQLIAFATVPAGGPPGYGVVARFAAPSQLPRQLKERGRPIQVDGRQAYQLPGPAAPAILMADDRTMLAAPAAVLPRMLANAPHTELHSLLQEATRSRLQTTAVVNLKPLRPLIQQGLGNVPPLPPQVRGLLELPQLVDSLTLVGKMQQRTAELTLRTADAESARRVNMVLSDTMRYARTMILAQMSEQIGEDPIERSGFAYMERILGVVERRLQPTVEGSELHLSMNMDVATTGVLVALLLPAVQAAREAARRTASMNHLKQIGLAMHQHHAQKGRFPPRATTDADGRPLLSWRVHLLPYMDQEPLYKQFHLDEPWDSPHNKTLIDKMPDVYRNPNQPTDFAGKTVYLAPDGEGTLFDMNQGPRIVDIKDGVANTIMVVEANLSEAVEWTKPGDLSYDSDRPLRGLGQIRPGIFLALLADGSVKAIANTVDSNLLRAMFTRAGRDN